MNPDCLWGRCLKQLYHPAEEFLQVKRGRYVSWSWSSLLHGRDILQKFCHWSVANGEKIDVKNDRWLVTGQLAKTKVGAQVSRVCELFMPNSRTWDLRKIKDNLDDSSAIQVIQTPVSWMA